MEYKVKSVEFLHAPLILDSGEPREHVHADKKLMGGYVKITLPSDGRFVKLEWSDKKERSVRSKTARDFQLVPLSNVGRILMEPDEDVRRNSAQREAEG